MRERGGIMGRERKKLNEKLGRVRVFDFYI